MDPYQQIKALESQFPSLSAPRGIISAGSFDGRSGVFTPSPSLRKDPRGVVLGRSTTGIEKEDLYWVIPEYVETDLQFTATNAPRGFRVLGGTEGPVDAQQGVATVSVGHCVRSNLRFRSTGAGLTLSRSI
jgi:hypothetical protein